MPVEIIVGNLFSRHPKNMNNVNRDDKDFLSVIKKLGTNVSGGKPVFLMEQELTT